MVLCGPMVRRVDAGRVSVFVATRDSARVRLTIHESADTASTEVVSAEAGTVPIGEHFHPVLVTAQLQQNQLEPGRSYGYNIQITAAGQTVNLAGLKLLEGENALGYEPGKLPTLVLPPDELEQLRFFHGSCRKPHGYGLDGMAALDSVLCSAATGGEETRPHQLFVTGDQIYADDVGAPLLKLARALGERVLGRQEQPPRGLGAWPPELQTTGESRQKLTEELAGFTSEEAANHLVTFSEYLGMYLLVYSPDAWPPVAELRNLMGDPPGVGDESIIDASTSNDEHRLWQFWATLPNVRRVLANIPTYMIFDDHDVTDDWNLSGDWCQKVYSEGRPLGRRIVQNALSAYAIFQGWGNDSAQFEEGKAGRKVLELLTSWSGEHDKDEQLQPLLRVDPRQPAEEGLNWHYAIRFHSHRLVVLDTRTCRRYNDEGEAGAELIEEKDLKRQLQDPLEHDDPDPPINVVVSPGPVFGVRLVEDLQRLSVSRLMRMNPVMRSLTSVSEIIDAEAWKLHEEAFQNLIRALGRGDRVVLLSGDVHYAFTKRCELFDQKTGQHSVIAQLTASSFKNESAALWVIHQWGSVLQGRDPRYYYGWDTSNGDITIRDAVGEQLGEPYNTADPIPKLMVRRIFKARNTVVVESKSREWMPDPVADWQYQLVTEGQPTSFRRAFADLFRAYGASLPDNMRLVRRRHAHLWRALKPSHAFWNTKYAGKTLIGVSCIGDITFEGEPLRVRHRLWWRKPLGEVGANTEHVTTMEPATSWPPPEDPKDGKAA